MAFYNLVRQLWAKTLLILLPRRFQVVRLLFLALGFPFRALLLVKSHGFRTGKFGLCIACFEKTTSPKMSLKEERTRLTEYCSPPQDATGFCFVSYPAFVVKPISGATIVARPYFAEMDLTMSPSVSPSVEAGS